MEKHLIISIGEQVLTGEGGEGGNITYNTGKEGMRVW